MNFWMLIRSQALEVHKKFTRICAMLGLFARCAVEGAKVGVAVYCFSAEEVMVTFEVEIETVKIIIKS